MAYTRTNPGARVTPRFFRFMGVPKIRGDSALQLFVRELQLLAGDLQRKDPYELGLRLATAVSQLPSNNGPLVWWTVRGLTTDAFIRICSQAGWSCRELELWRGVCAASQPRQLADLLSRQLHLCQQRASHLCRVASDTRIECAVKYIRENCSRPSLAVEDVASHVRLSRWHLSRLLVRYLGESYREVLRHTRMEKAQRLLRDGVLSVKEVAARVGYPYATEFDRVFKQCFGVTPTAWRARCSGRRHEIGNSDAVG